MGKNISQSDVFPVTQCDPQTIPAPVTSPALVKPINDYAELKRLIRKSGLLEKQPAYYTYKTSVTLGLLAFSVLLLFTIHSFWFQLGNAALLAMISAQFGFLGHDAGHRQIFRSTRKNEFFILLMANLSLGMSTSWWLDKHNAHHSHPNEIDMDPDIDIGVLAFSDEEVRSKKGLRRLMVKHQKYFFFPLLSLIALDLQFRSVLYLARHKEKYSALEAVLLILHHALYFGMIFFCLNPWQALIFILVHQMLFGVFLGTAFAPNHKGMPLLEKHSPVDFLRRQVLTARNVRSGLFTDFWYGGLNYQVEHHLFPNMPRNNLKKAQRIVEAYCHEHEIAYYQTGVLQSFREILQFLHEVSAPLRVKQITTKR